MVLVTIFSVFIEIRIQPSSIFHNIYIQKPMSQKLGYHIWSLTCKFIEILSSGAECYKYGSFRALFVFLCFFVCNYGSKRSCLVIIKWIGTLIIMIVCLKNNINTIFIK